MIVEHGDLNRIKFDEARNTSSLMIGLVAKKPDDPDLANSLSAQVLWWNWKR